MRTLARMTLNFALSNHISVILPPKIPQLVDSEDINHLDMSEQGDLFC